MSTCLDDVDPLNPPPLPEKKRSPSASAELLDSLSSAALGRSKPPMLNNSVSLDHSLASAGHQMPVMVRAMLSSPTHPSGNGVVSTTSVSSSSSSSSSLTFSTSSSSTMQQQQQHSVVQQSSKTVTTHQTFSRTVSDSKLSSSSSRKGKTFDEINQLTDQIKELTNTIQEIPPPLPAKKSSMQRLNSQYDNIPESIEDRLAALSSTSSNLSSSSSFSSHQRTTVVMRKEARVSSSSTSSSQSSFSNQR